MSEELERAMLAEVRDMKRKREGVALKGWLGPFIWQSRRTPELLKRQGIRT